MLYKTTIMFYKMKLYYECEKYFSTKEILFTRHKPRVDSYSYMGGKEILIHTLVICFLRTTQCVSLSYMVVGKIRRDN